MIKKTIKQLWDINKIIERTTPEIENTQKRILVKLMYTPHLKFNELWDKHGESNKFAYHLKKLEKNGLIIKADESYKLTHKGKTIVAYLQSKTGKELKAPLLCVALLIFDKKKNNVLMLKREKEPFYGYCGFHGGKIAHSEYIFESAQRFLSETGLTGELALKGIFSIKTFEAKELSYNHQFFVVAATNLKGKIIQKIRKGTNHWVSIKKIREQNIFPNSEFFLKIALQKKFQWIEADRMQENDLFKGITIKKDVYF